MPNILRFRGFNIMIFVDDHEPAHIHAYGNDGFAKFTINCPNGPVIATKAENLKRQDERALEAFLNDNLPILCERWREIDDKRKGMARG